MKKWRMLAPGCALVMIACVALINWRSYSVPPRKTPDSQHVTADGSIVHSGGFLNPEYESYLYSQGVLIVAASGAGVAALFCYLLSRRATNPPNSIEPDDGHPSE